MRRPTTGNARVRPAAVRPDYRNIRAICSCLCAFDIFTHFSHFIYILLTNIEFSIYIFYYGYHTRVIQRQHFTTSRNRIFTVKCEVFFFVFMNTYKVINTNSVEKSFKEKKCSIYTLEDLHVWWKYNIIIRCPWSENTIKVYVFYFCSRKIHESNNVGNILSLVLCSKCKCILGCLPDYLCIVI